MRLAEEMAKSVIHTVMFAREAQKPLDKATHYYTLVMQARAAGLDDSAPRDEYNKAIRDLTSRNPEAKTCAGELYNLALRIKALSSRERVSFTRSVNTMLVRIGTEKLRMNLSYFCKERGKLLYLTARHKLFESMSTNLLVLIQAMVEAGVSVTPDERVKPFHYAIYHCDGDMADMLKTIGHVNPLDRANLGFFVGVIKRLAGDLPEPSRTEQLTQLTRLFHLDKSVTDYKCVSENLRRVVDGRMSGVDSVLMPYIKFFVEHCAEPERAYSVESAGAASVTPSGDGPSTVFAPLLKASRSVEGLSRLAVPPSDKMRCTTPGGSCTP